MDDEELFQEIMGGLGVEPLGAGGRRQVAAPGPAARRRGEGGRDGARAKRPPPQPRPPHLDAEDAVFLDVMARLEAAPDKDRQPAVPREEGLRRLKPSQVRDTLPDATLDLHGKTTVEAELGLERFVAAAAGQGQKVVVVITGKGLRSESGTGVLRQVVERWLHRAGKRWVRGFAEAPRSLGGRGAFVFHLR